jgi:hypothetical protein
VYIQFSYCMVQIYSMIITHNETAEKKLNCGNGNPDSGYYSFTNLSKFTLFFSWINTTTGRSGRLCTEGKSI